MKEKERHKKAVNKYRSNNKEKRSAWDKAGRGIGHIKIEGKCQMCKTNDAKQRHHPDYSKQREVVLVCVQCHNNIHSQSPQDVYDKNRMYEKDTSTLSDKIIKLTDGKEDNWISCCLRDDVREFIKKLKENILGMEFEDSTPLWSQDAPIRKYIEDEIDKLAGDKLI